MLRPDLSPSPAHQTPHLPSLETDDYRLAQGRRDGRRGTLSHGHGCPARGSAVTSPHERRPPWTGNGYYLPPPFQPPKMVTGGDPESSGMLMADRKSVV